MKVKSLLLLFKIAIRIILLCILAILSFYAIYQTYNPGLYLAQKDIKVGVALYSNIQDGRLLTKEIDKISCEKSGCLFFDVKNTLESEFLRYSKNKTNFDFNIEIPAEQSLKHIENPQGFVDGFALIFDLIKSFQNHSMNYFNYDMRLFMNIVEKNARDYSESSIGSTKSRVGLIEWQVTDRKSYIWNVTKTLHEMGHMLGARDKYMKARKSHYPTGYVNPEFGMNRPQIYTEIMSGTRPINRFIEIEPTLIQELRFGYTSALEMGWLPKRSTAKSH